MKLINKTLLYYIVISIPLLLIACIFSYFTVRGELMENTDEFLEKEMSVSEELIKQGKVNRITYLSPDSLSSIRVYHGQVLQPAFQDTLLYDSFEDEIIKYRMLRGTHFFSGKNYLITIIKPSIEEEDLMESLSTSFIIILILIILIFSGISWFLSRSLWKPFYKTLDQLNAFDTRKNMHVFFGHSSIKEFAQLNETLERMSRKIFEDYLHQKEFTENSAHEMQTPLAIIKANIGLLMQSPRLNAEEMSQLESIEHSAKKLSSLNKALLLLAKIDNNQFTENTAVNVKELVIRITAELDTFIQLKELHLSLNVEDYIILQMNPVLAELLFTNLIQNAIRHTAEKGIITIELKNRRLSVRNSGPPLAIAPAELFLRFKKNDSSKDSLGLGLAIAKSIADLYELTIDYAYQNGEHRFDVPFMPYAG